MRSTTLVAAFCALFAFACESPTQGGPSAARSAQSAGTPEASNALSVDLIRSSPCLTAHDALLRDMAALTTQHALGCSSDSDCTNVTTALPCQTGCLMAVRAEARALFEAERDALGATRCPLLPTECGIGGFCPTVSGARCQAGVCMPILEGVLQSPIEIPAVRNALGERDGG